MFRIHQLNRGVDVQIKALSQLCCKPNSQSVDNSLFTSKRTISITSNDDFMYVRTKGAHDGVWPLLGAFAILVKVTRTFAFSFILNAYKHIVNNRINNECNEGRNYNWLQRPSTLVQGSLFHFYFYTLLLLSRAITELLPNQHILIKRKLIK